MCRLHGRLRDSYGGKLKSNRQMSQSLRIFIFGILMCQSWGYVRAQCQVVTGSTVPLYWDANSESDMNRYHVSRSSTSGSGYSVIGIVPQGPDPVSFTDTTPLSTSYYVLKALNVNLVESGFSNEICIQLNVAPTAVDDDAITSEDTAIVIDVLGNDTDADGDSLTVDTLTQPTNGSVVVNADETVSYTPASNFNGIDNFGYTVADGKGGKDMANVSVSVTAVPDAPTAVDDSAKTNPNVPVIIDVLSNDRDADGNSLTVDSVTDPTNGSVAINANQTVSYTPASEFIGSDNFMYTVADGLGLTDTAKVSVIVAVNNPPIAVDDSRTTNEDAFIDIHVLSNDTDGDGDSLTVNSVTDPTNGSVVINANETVRYTPTSNSNGNDNFNYTVSDGKGGEDTANVSVTVVAVEDAPTAVDDSAITNLNAVIDINVLSNDTDADGDGLTVDSVTDPTNGSVVINADETLSYTPATDFSGDDNFVYTVADGTGLTDTANVAVTVAEPSVLIAHFMNGNNAFLDSRVYLWNSSKSSGEVTVRVFTLPVAGGTSQELTDTPLNLGSLRGESALNLKLAEDILVPLGIPMPYTDDGGNLTLEFTSEAPVQGSGQVFSSNLAFGTYPLQRVQPTSGGNPTVLVAHFMNGNETEFNSRAYLWNPSTEAGSIKARLFSLGSHGASSRLGTVDLGTLEASSGRNIRLVEDILAPLESFEIILPYTADGGNLTLELTIDAPGVQGVGQVFSSDLAFGTYPLQEVLSTSGPDPTVLVSHFMNGNNVFLDSRVYLWNPSQSSGEVTARVFTLPVAGGTSQELTDTPLDLGILRTESALNVKLAERILAPLGIPLPYTDNGGNLTLELTIDAPDVSGVGQVFSSDVAFGTYPLQEVLSTSGPDPTVLVAHFMNGNNAFLNSRVYLWNSSQSSGEVTVRVFTLPLVGGTAQQLTETPFNLGSLGAESGRNIKVVEDILAPLGMSLPYTDDGGNLTLEFTIGAPNVQGVAQVFSSDLAFGTYPLQ